VLAASWLGILGWAGKQLLDYENTPAKPGQPPREWPADSSIRRSRGQFTLLMLVHPNCPCTSASLSELEKILTQDGARVTATILFTKPETTEQDARASALARRAQHIPGLNVLFDPKGTETKRFDGTVSGQTLLYSPDGRLLFSGGITAARGHQGINPGEEAVVQLIEGQEHANQVKAHPVFGCSLHDPSEEERQSGLWTKR